MGRGPHRVKIFDFSRDIKTPMKTGLWSLCENYSSRPQCVAPTVLRIMIATVPSPSGLGYVVARLRRSGFVAVNLCKWAVAKDSGVAACESRLSAGGAKDRSPARKGWVHDNVGFGAP